MALEGIEKNGRYMMSVNICLKNIGIVSDSNIELNGLTVVTGHNNSGKTTVGKALYSIVDAVADLEGKANREKNRYMKQQLDEAHSILYVYIRLLREHLDESLDECILTFFTRAYKKMSNKNTLQNFLENLYFELQKLSFDDEPYRTMVKRAPEAVFFEEMWRTEAFSKDKQEALSILQETLVEVKKDPELIDYAKRSIERNLKIEFLGQIQPVAEKNIFSKIEMTDGSKKCFSFEIYDNQIVNEEEPIYRCSPYKNAFFIDNPFVIGDVDFLDYGYIDPRTRGNHEDKLRINLKTPMEKTIFESGVIEQKYQNIKNKIDEVLPGEFTFVGDEQYYVYKDAKLKSGNLATGSKMFSILKLLLAKGEISEKTLLVLDEPEAHLHPKWQNAFAEVMVLLAKEVGCHILLTTHSPNFMLGLEANMRKHDVEELCNFYQTKHLPDSVMVEYANTNDALEYIYDDFVTYLSEMKMLRDMYWE